MRWSNLAWLVPVAMFSWVAGPRATVDLRGVRSPDVRPPLEDWVVAQERDVPGLRPGSAKTIVWAGEPEQRTKIAVVVLHGYSADREEIRPVPDRIAAELDANLFFQRMTGHGRDPGEAMAEGSAEDLLSDALEAIAVGKLLGDRVVVIGTSTGGTLATWLAAEGAPEDVAAMVLFSPNYGVHNPLAGIALWPWGRPIVLAAQGETYGWEPASEAEALHWTTSYPTRALTAMVALVRHVRQAPLHRVVAPSLVVFSDQDQVVSPAKTKEALARFGSAPRVHQMTGDDPYQHVITGAIKSPSTVDEAVEVSLAFLRDAL